MAEDNVNKLIIFGYYENHKSIRPLLQNAPGNVCDVEMTFYDLVGLANNDSDGMHV